MNLQQTRAGTLLPIVAILLTTSCVTPDPALSPGNLEPREIGTIQRLHASGDFLLGSQPAPEDFSLLTESGIRTVVNLRTPGEQELDEGALVRQLGMNYHHVPFRAATELTDEALDQLRSILGNPENRPLLLHCASGNRVGAVWLAYRVLDEGQTLEEAEREAREVGLKSPSHLERAREYVGSRAENSKEESR